MTPSYYSDSSSYTETNIDNSSENVIPKIADELKKSATPSQRQRRRLVRQKVVSESPPNLDKCILLNLYELSECRKKRGSVSQSHPTLLVQNKDGVQGCEVCRCKMSNVNCRSTPKHSTLHRSQSSGAERARARERHLYSQRGTPRDRRSRVHLRKHMSEASNASSLTRDNSVSQSDKNVTLSPDQSNSEQSAPLKSPCRNYPHTRDSTIDSGSFDWSADEAACDEEVRLITGTPPETEDELITPSWQKEDSSNTECSLCSTVIQSERTPTVSDRLNHTGAALSSPHSVYSSPPQTYSTVEIPVHSSSPSGTSGHTPHEHLSPNVRNSPDRQTSPNVRSKNSPDRQAFPNARFPQDKLTLPNMRNSPEKLTLPTLSLPKSPRPPRLSPLYLPVHNREECPSSGSNEEQSSLLIPRVNTPVPLRNNDNVSHNSISSSGADKLCDESDHCDKHLEDSDQSTSVIKPTDKKLTLRRRLHSSGTVDED